LLEKVSLVVKAWKKQLMPADELRSRPLFVIFQRWNFINALLA
jgi:hypothetical protein